MAAKPKLTPEELSNAQNTWESDAREGYTWLVRELSLPVSAPAIRKAAIKAGWTKFTENKQVTSKVSMVSNENHKKVSTIVPETKEKGQDTQIIKVKGLKKSELQSSERKNKVGRPTDYREAYVDQVYDLCLKGYTDKMLAAAFGIDESTLNEWKKKYEKFSLSIARGKTVVDAEVIASVYVGVTTGHTTVEDRVVIGEDGRPEIIKIEKQHKPEVQNQQLWLKNRQPESWKDRVEVDASIDLKETSLDFLMENYIKVMDKARERDRAMRIDRGLAIDAEFKSLE